MLKAYYLGLSVRLGFREGYTWEDQYNDNNHNKHNMHLERIMQVTRGNTGNNGDIRNISTILNQHIEN